MQDFKSFLHALAVRNRLKRKKKKKYLPKDTSSQFIMPGEHRTNQQIGQDPNEDPSSSSFSPRG